LILSVFSILHTFYPSEIGLYPSKSGWTGL